ncbi:MAG: DUF4845 domain-containing protein [Lysobacterales bacterium]
MKSNHLNSKSRQKGITLIGLIIVLSLLGFAAFIGMKLFPVYQEYFSVVQAMKSVAKQPGVNRQEPRQIQQMLIKRMYVSYVESVKQQHIKVSRGAVPVLTVSWEVRRSLIGNLDFVAKFDESIDLKG